MNIRLFLFLRNFVAVLILGLIALSLFSCTPKDKTENLIADIKVTLKDKGYNIDSVPIVYVEKCAVNARVLDGKIQICNKFFNYEFRDQVSIIWHEAFHLNNDRVWNENLILLEQPVYIENVPQDIADYINDVVNTDLEDYSKRIAYDRITSLYEIRDSVYYENEIAAYREEINTIKDVSPEYDAERKYMLWKHTESLNIARIYYLLY